MTLCDNWKKEEEPILILVQMNVKSLGTRLGVGRRRIVAFLNQRLKAFKLRGPKYRKMRKLGIDPARVVRTGGLAGMVFGQAVTGVYNSMFLGQRRAVGGGHRTGQRQLRAGPRCGARSGGWQC